MLMFIASVPDKLPKTVIRFYASGKDTINFMPGAQIVRGF